MLPQCVPNYKAFFKYFCLLKIVILIAKGKRDEKRGRLTRCEVILLAQAHKLFPRSAGNPAQQHHAVASLIPEEAVKRLFISPRP